MLAPLQARRSLRRVFATALVLGLLLPVAVAILPAQAATPAFSESFRDASLAGNPLNWTSSRGQDSLGPNGTVPSEYACLTALAPGSAIQVAGYTASSLTDNPGVGLIVGCPGSGSNAINANGDGALRLTSDAFMQSAVVIYNQQQKMSDGLDITFSFAIHSGIAASPHTGADGLSFFIKDGSNASDTAGGPGGSLGYGLRVGSSPLPGVPGALLGVGFDFFGSFSINQAPRPALSCPSGPTIPLSDPSATRVYDRVVLRGPDLSAAQDGLCGYAYLGRSAAAVNFGRRDKDDPGAAADGVESGLPAASRGTGQRRARIVIDKPSTNAPRVKVWVWPVGQPQPTATVLDLPQPAELQGVNTFKFGFGASTGFASNVHEIWDLQILLADPAVQAVQAEQAAAARAASSVSPTLVCSPDPVQPGAEVQCTISSGPAGVEILWRASIDGRVVDSRGVTLGADGGASFTFRAPSDAAGSLVDIELVDWGVATTVGVSGGPVPTRVNAGEGVRQRMTTDALLLLVAGSLALGVLGRRRWARSS